MEQCWACKSEITASATYCKHCDKWQNWRKWLDFSAVNLSLLVALVSVIGTSAPVIISTFRIPNSTVQSYVEDVSDRGVKAIIYNSSDYLYFVGDTMECYFNGAKIEGSRVMMDGTTLELQSANCPDGKGVFPMMFPGESCNVFFLPKNIVTYSGESALPPYATVDQCIIPSNIDQPAGALRLKPMSTAEPKLRQLSVTFPDAVEHELMD